MKFVKEVTDHLKSDTNKSWLILHFYITCIVILSTFLGEVIFGLIIMSSDGGMLFEAPYALQYILLPTSANLALMLLAYFVAKKSKYDYDTKSRYLSLIFSGVCFIMLLFFGMFTVTYYAFSIAVILTVPYNDLSLTRRTFWTSFGLLFSAEILNHQVFNRIPATMQTMRVGEFLTAVAIFGALGLASIEMVRYGHQKETRSAEIAREHHILKERLYRDPLTGLYNKDRLHAVLDRCIDDATRFPLAFTILDIDYFKEINDNYGHHVGDLCLYEFSKLLRDEVNPWSAYRFGGDEFCLISQGNDVTRLIDGCNQFIKKVNTLRIIENSDITLTASIGISYYTLGTSSAELFVQADRALYQAKETRNRICVYDDSHVYSLTETPCITRASFLDEY